MPPDYSMRSHCKGGGMTTTTTRRGDLRLRPPRNPVDPRAVGWWRTTLALLFGVPFAALVALGLLIPPARAWFLLPAALVAVVGVPLVLALPRWWYRVHRWEVTDAAAYTRSGYFWQEWRGAATAPGQTAQHPPAAREPRLG